MSRDLRILRVAADIPSSTHSANQLGLADDEFTVLTAATASDGRKIVDTTPVDCVVCDANLDATTGLDLLVQLREADPDLPFILVLTADAQITVDEALAAGVTDCVLASTDHPSWPLLVANRIRNAIGQSHQSVADTSQDQTQRQDLTASEAKYRSLIEDVLNVSYVGTFVLDADFSVVWINDSIETYFGVDRDEIVGADKRSLIVNDISDLFADPTEFSEKVLATYDNNSYIEQFECYVNPTVDHEGRWLEHRSYPITKGPYEGGRIEHYVDITARKHREQDLETERQLLDRLFETSPVGIALLDGDGQLIRANKYAKTVLDLSRSTLLGRSYDDPEWTIHDKDGEPIPSDELPFARVKQTGEPVFGYEHGITLADGTTRWLSINAAPLTTDDGIVDRVISAVVDMTAIRDSEQELAQQNERLTEFASIVSHDLRNPLNVLAGSLELAHETGETVHFERSQRAIDRMGQLIDDLLSLARTGEAIDRTEAVDIGALTAECWQHLSADKATLQIETDQVVTADRSRLTQLFENLFGNAVEHGGATVTITVGELADGFFVDDDGVGIPAADREQIFERGYSTNREGTGLGLSIVAQIAEAHGWEISLADSESGGVRIEVTGVELLDTETDSETPQPEASHTPRK
jgi:PAS domain S-box-containing protein